jgi:hypothetical protein
MPGLKAIMEFGAGFTGMVPVSQIRTRMLTRLKRLGTRFIGR